MSTDRGMGGEDVIHTYSEVLLSHENEHNWATLRDVDGPRDCHTEWRKSEREKQIILNYHLYVESRDMTQMNLFTKQK